MADWRFEADRAIELALTSNTHKACNSAGCQFVNFRQHEGLSQLWPIPVTQLMQFCVDLKGKGLSTHPIRGKFSAFAFANKAAGFIDDTGENARRLVQGRSST